MNSNKTRDVSHITGHKKDCGCTQCLCWRNLDVSDICQSVDENVVRTICESVDEEEKRK